MDATELLYEAKELAGRIHPAHRAKAMKQVERAEEELEALEGRMRRLIGILEQSTHTTHREAA